jgi:hypothetical protein
LAATRAYDDYGRIYLAEIPAEPSKSPVTNDWS